MHAQHFLKGECWAISVLEVNIDYLMSTSKKLALKCQILPSVLILFQTMVTVVSFLFCSPGAVEMLSNEAISTFYCQSLPMYYCEDGCVAAGGEVKEPCPQTQVTVCMLTFEEK